MGIFSYRISVSYDGSAYHGWQLQPGFATIQASLEHALSTALREPRQLLAICAAGRTDAGVHAVGQVVQFYSNHIDLEGSKTEFQLNRLLPPDIRVSSLKRTAPDFSVTMSAVSKTYHFSIDTNSEHDPITYRFRMHVPKPLDLEALREALAMIRGTHDFTQFSNNSESGRKRNPIKTLYRVDLVPLQGGLRIEYEGSGFLYKMVRQLTGACLAVGLGKLQPGFIKDQLDLGSSRTPGQGGFYRGFKVAASKGLCLHSVKYMPDVDDASRLLYPELKHDEFGRLLDFLPSSLDHLDN